MKVGCLILIKNTLILTYFKNYGGEHFPQKNSIESFKRVKVTRTKNCRFSVCFVGLIINNIRDPTI